MTSGSVVQDKGWAWLVMLAAFFNISIAAIPFCIGVYVNEIIVELGVNHVTGGFFGALQLAAVFFGGPATYVSEMYSYRIVIFVASLVGSISVVASIFITNIYVLFITFSTIPGLAIGVIFIQSVIVVNKYFNKYAGFANGFVLSGCGLGTMVIPMVYDAIIEAYSFRKSLFIVAGITLQGCVFAMVMKPIHVHSTENTLIPVKNSEPDASSRDVLFKNPTFYLFLLSNTLLSASMSVVFVLAANLFYEQNVTNKSISILLAVVGFGNLGSRIVVGCLLQLLRQRLNAIGLHIIISVIQAVSLALFVVDSSFANFAVGCILFGFSYGASTVTQAIVPRIIAGLKHYPTAYSISLGSCVIGISAGPSLTGFIYDATRSYTVAFMVNSGFALTAGLVMCLSYYFDRKPTYSRHGDVLIIDRKVDNQALLIDNTL